MRSCMEFRDGKARIEQDRFRDDRRALLQSGHSDPVVEATFVDLRAPLLAGRRSRGRSVVVVVRGFSHKICEGQTGAMGATPTFAATSEHNLSLRSNPHRAAFEPLASQ